jgi:hypothetical protein
VSPSGDTGEIEAAMFDYAMRAGDGFPAEQLWHLDGAEAPAEAN